MTTIRSLSLTSSCIFAILTMSISTVLGQELPRIQQTFHDDLAFLKQHTPIVLLEKGDSAVAIAPAYQGRVMTSTVDKHDGPSFGWINRRVIEAGLLSDDQRKGTLEEHIYIFGGEERFWLGPEGGQFALFFQPGTKFEFSAWKTPAAIDTEPFKLVKQTDTSAEFTHDCTLTNYSGTKFKMGIQRSIRLLDESTIAKALRTKEIPNGVQVVAYESDNRLTNRGEKAWSPESGLPSIWLLGMYNPSPKTTVVIPFKRGDVESLGPKVNDTYFGKVPKDYLKVEENVLFFKGDGTHRGKIGLTPQRSQGVAGSYDAAAGVLTIVSYNVQDASHGYVNSMWELQEKPYDGDVINAYNDGAPSPGEPPLGPFYELETSSPAAALKPGETMRHVQQTLHIQGDEEELTPIVQRVFGVSLKKIESTFRMPNN